MSGVFENLAELPAPERRVHARQPVRTLTYVELDEGNGGIVLNASEGGLSVQAVTGLMDDALPKVRFHLSQSKGWLEAPARVVWANDSRKVAGLEFVELPEAGRELIREWLAGESTTEESSATAAGDDGEAAAASEEAAAVAEANGAATAPPKQPLASPAGSLDESPARESSPLAHGLFAERAVAREAGADRAWNLAGLIAVLAIVSLIAGWIAGRGTLASLWQGLDRQNPAAQAAQRNASAADTAAPSASVSEIETIDIHDQRWTVPLIPTAGRPPTSSYAQQSPAPSPWPAYNPALATPQIQARSAGDASAEQLNPPAVAGPTDGGVSISFDQSVDPSRIQPPAEAAPERAASVLQRGVLIYHVNPIYPELAKEQEVQGTVKLEITIGADGVVRSVFAVSGPGLLVEAARDAVRRWRYTPTLLDGKPVESQTTVSVIFHLPSSPR